MKKIANHFFLGMIHRLEDEGGVGGYIDKIDKKDMKILMKKFLKKLKMDKQHWNEKAIIEKKLIIIILFYISIHLIPLNSYRW